MRTFVSKICDAKDGRSKILVVKPEWFVDVFLNLDKVKVIGLPSDVQVQSMVYDPHSHLILMRLWSSEFDVVDANDEEILLLPDEVCVDRVTGAENQKPASASASEANPWRYFRDLTGGVVRVRDESGGCYYYASEPSRKSTLPLSFWARASLEAPAKLGEITEDEAAKIVGGRPWEQSVRYFYAFHSPSRGIVRFVGEEGTIYRINGCSTKTVLSLSWHEQSGVEVEISEEQAVAILGGNRPWDQPADV